MHIRASVPDRSTRSPTSLIIEWDKNKLTLFRVQKDESGRFFSGDLDHGLFENQEFEMNGKVSASALCGAIDTVLTALRAS